MEKRLILFLVLSSVIFIGWSYLYERQFPRPVEQQNEKREQAANGKEASPSTTPGPGEAETAGQSPAPAAAAPSTEVTRVDPKEITLTTDHWQARISNQGAVLTEWIMNSFTDGKPIDPPQGVVLTSPQVSREVGGPLRFYLPSDRALEKELNTAGYQLVGDTPERLTLRQGETISLRFQYVNRGIEATKEFVFRGVAPGTGPNVASGFDFDLRATVRRQGVPVEAFLVVGPNFGDQKVTEVNIYKHAPQLTYAIGGSVERETAESLRDEGTSPLETEGLVSWAAVDDNYFAMAAIPPHTVRAFRFVDREKYVSMAVALDQAAPYRIYAGPKDLETLSTISDSLRLQDRGKGLEDIVSYGWLNFVSFLIKPIAQFMLLSLREINKLTNNFGWSIVLLTIILNMFFFPLRWKSSVTMRRAAAMQPKMKDLQDRMKKLEKNDPRMLELQKEQIALMKEGNPLMGCLPLAAADALFHGGLRDPDRLDRSTECALRCLVDRSLLTGPLLGSADHDVCHHDRPTGADADHGRSNPEADRLRHATRLYLVFESGTGRIGSLLDGQQPRWRRATVRHQSAQPTSPDRAGPQGRGG